MGVLSELVKGRKGYQLGLNELALIMLALLVGITIFVFLTRPGGFIDKIKDVACWIATNVADFMKITGVESSDICANI